MENSNISSLFKKGSRTEYENYWRISVFSSIGRLYGRILKNRIEHGWSILYNTTNRENYSLEK